VVGRRELARLGLGTCMAALCHQHFRAELALSQCLLRFIWLSPPSGSQIGTISQMAWDLEQGMGVHQFPQMVQSWVWASGKPLSDFLYLESAPGRCRRLWLSHLQIS
jgi:hypothetical protein